MPSKDTVHYNLTIKTHKALERIRQVISKELGIDVSNITYKQAEITMRVKAQRGKVYVRELRDIMLGKIK